MGGPLGSQSGQHVHERVMGAVLRGRPFGVQDRAQAHRQLRLVAPTLHPEAPVDTAELERRRRRASALHRWPVQ